MLPDLEAPVSAKIDISLNTLANDFKNHSDITVSEEAFLKCNTDGSCDIDFLDNEVNCYSYCGGGGVVDISNIIIPHLHGYGVGFEHYPHTLTTDYNVFMAGQIPANTMYINKENLNRAAIPMYDSKNEHIYDAILYDNLVNAGQTTMYDNFYGYDHNCFESIMSFTNFNYYSHNEWACIVYIHGGANQDSKGYYLYQRSLTSDHCGLTPYKYPLEGALYITRNVAIHMVAISKQHGLEICKDVGYNTPKTVYDNYCKDVRAYQYYGHSYDTHLTMIIDAIINHENLDLNSHRRLNLIVIMIILTSFRTRACPPRGSLNSQGWTSHMSMVIRITEGLWTSIIRIRD